MRKLIVVAALVMALAAITASAAFANNGPHGNYTLTTGKCAACHRAHTAPGADLLLAASPDRLCATCHSGGPATTNVWSGQTSGGGRLNGGGFVSLPTGSVTSVPASTHQVNGVTTPINVSTSGGSVSSRHDVADLLGIGNPSGTGTAWGGASSGQGVTGELECVSCHNPHGSTNYRLLKDTQNGYPYGASGYNSHKWVPNDPNLLQWGTHIVDANTIITGVDGIVQAMPTDGPSYATDYVTNYTGGMREFCATCHKSYLTFSGSATVPSTTTGGPYAFPGSQDANDGNGDIARYRHATARTVTAYGSGAAQPIRLAFSYTTSTSANEFTCLTCHFAHGTASGYGADGYTSNVAPTNDTALLYYDGRGVCRSCHQKGK